MKVISTDIQRMNLEVPARVNLSNGTIEVDQKFDDFPAPVQSWLLLHEQGHIMLNTKEESRANAYADKHFAKKFSEKHLKEVRLWMRRHFPVMYGGYANFDPFDGGNYGGGSFNFGSGGNWGFDPGGSFGYGSGGWDFGGGFRSDSDNSGWFQGPGWEKAGEVLSDIADSLPALLKTLFPKKFGGPQQGGGEQPPEQPPVQPPPQQDNTTTYIIIGGVVVAAILMIVFLTSKK